MKAAERRDGPGLRHYPASPVAKVGAAGSFDEAPIRAFGPLAGYINGATRSPGPEENRADRAGPASGRRPTRP